MGPIPTTTDPLTQTTYSHLKPIHTEGLHLQLRLRRYFSFDIHCR